MLDFFQKQSNIENITRLKEYGLQFELQEINTMVSNVLDGKIFVVSGVFELFSRDELKKAIEDNGGKVGSSISAKTNYVIAGANMGPSKLEKANQLKVEIITEYQFRDMIHE